MSEFIGDLTIFASGPGFSALLSWVLMIALGAAGVPLGFLAVWLLVMGATVIVIAVSLVYHVISA